jgi:hypothetical protein
MDVTDVEDVNLALISGLLALPADLERLPDGSQRARLLVVVHSECPKRFDVVPVLVPPEICSGALEAALDGARVRIAGSLMRRVSVDPWEPASRIEVIAAAISLPDH